MTRRGNKRSSKASVIQNVRVVDQDEGSDDVRVSNMLTTYAASEGQIRVVCGNRTELTYTAGASNVFGYDSLAGSDDFISFAAQYQEFRVRGIRFTVYDVQPSSAATINYIATWHQIGGTVPSTQDNIVDRPDARSIAPGAGHVRLSWLGHGTPEMDFQSTATYNSLGGLVIYASPAAAITGTKYLLVAKYIVDFRGRY